MFKSLSQSRKVSPGDIVLEERAGLGWLAVADGCRDIGMDFFVATNVTLSLTKATNEYIRKLCWRYGLLLFLT